LTDDKFQIKLQDIFKNLKFDEIINQAVLNSLTDEARDKMMEKIIEYLTSVEGDSYYNKKTVIENLFNDSIREPVRKTMQEVVSSDIRITDKCREIASKAVDEFMQKNVNEMVKVMVERMSGAFTEKETRY
jgi:hypothetical protein